MTQREFRDFLQDILEAICELKKMTQRITFAEFSTRIEVFLSVVKLIEIIGEAVKNIPDDIRVNYPDILWTLFLTVPRYLSLIVFQLSPLKHGFKMPINSSSNLLSVLLVKRSIRLRMTPVKNTLKNCVTARMMTTVTIFPIGRPEKSRFLILLKNGSLIERFTPLENRIGCNHATL
jgi:uncharacterized protein with HEPN domain